MKSERIELENIKNCRDLGGMVTKDGHEIKKRCLYRSNHLFGASQNDMKRLHDEYGLRRIIDLRNGVEIYQKKDPEYEGIEYIERCVHYNEFFGVTQDEESVRKMNEFFERMDREYVYNPASAGTHMEDFYRELLDDYGVRAYGEFMRLVLECEGAVLWHCSLGKDRCGVATALVLEMLGVDREDIIEDYLYTNICLYESEEIPFSPEGFLHYAHRSFIEAYYKEAEIRFGSIDGLFMEMGLDEDFKERFRKKYLVL